MKNLILEGGNNPQSIQARGLFSFVVQFVSVHRAYFDDNDQKIFFDLRDSAYSTTGGNHWDLFFIQDPISPGERTVWGRGGNHYGYSFDFDDIQERKIAKKIIDKHLILRPQIQEPLDEFYEKNMKDKKILGIHKRGTDIHIHHHPASLDSFFERVDQVVNQYDGIYLSTDEKFVVDQFKSRYDKILNASYQTLSDQPQMPNFKTHQGRSQGFEVGKDAILDAYLLSKTDFLIKGNSNLSNFSLLLNPDLKFICI